MPKSLSLSKLTSLIFPLIFNKLVVRLNAVDAQNSVLSAFDFFVTIAGVYKSYGFVSKNNVMLSSSVVNVVTVVAPCEFPLSTNCFM